MLKNHSVIKEEWQPEFDGLLLNDYHQDVLLNFFQMVHRDYKVKMPQSFKQSLLLSPSQSVINSMSLNGSQKMAPFSTQTSIDYNVEDSPMILQALHNTPVDVDLFVNDTKNQLDVYTRKCGLQNNDDCVHGKTRESEKLNTITNVRDNPNACPSSPSNSQLDLSNPCCNTTFSPTSKETQHDLNHIDHSSINAMPLPYKRHECFENTSSTLDKTSQSISINTTSRQDSCIDLLLQFTIDWVDPAFDKKGLCDHLPYFSHRLQEKIKAHMKDVPETYFESVTPRLQDALKTLKKNQCFHWHTDVFKDFFHELKRDQVLYFNHNLTYIVHFVQKVIQHAPKQWIQYINLCLYYNIILLLISHIHDAHLKIECDVHLYLTIQSCLTNQNFQQWSQNSLKNIEISLASMINLIIHQNVMEDAHDIKNTCFFTKKNQNITQIIRDGECHDQHDDVDNLQNPPNVSPKINVLQPSHDKDLSMHWQSKMSDWKAKIPEKRKRTTQSSHKHKKADGILRLCEAFKDYKLTTTLLSVLHILYEHPRCTVKSAIYCRWTDFSQFCTHYASTWLNAVFEEIGSMYNTVKQTVCKSHNKKMVIVNADKDWHLHLPLNYHRLWFQTPNALQSIEDIEADYHHSNISDSKLNHMFTSILLDGTHTDRQIFDVILSLTQKKVSSNLDNVHQNEKLFTPERLVGKVSHQTSCDDHSLLSTKDLNVVHPHCVIHLSKWAHFIHDVCLLALSNAKHGKKKHKVDNENKKMTIGPSCTFVNTLGFNQHLNELIAECFFEQTLLIEQDEFVNIDDTMSLHADPINHMSNVISKKRLRSADNDVNTANIIYSKRAKQACYDGYSYTHPLVDTDIYNQDTTDKKFNELNKSHDAFKPDDKNVEKMRQDNNVHTVFKDTPQAFHIWQKSMWFNMEDHGVIAHWIRTLDLSSCSRNAILNYMILTYLYQQVNIVHPMNLSQHITHDHIMSSPPNIFEYQNDKSKKSHCRPSTHSHQSSEINNIEHYFILRSPKNIKIVKNEYKIPCYLIMMTMCKHLSLELTQL